jgi:hypothetical protein
MCLYLADDTRFTQLISVIDTCIWDTETTVNFALAGALSLSARQSQRPAIMQEL